MSTRLNKYISETGYCSRREADKLIEQGLVKVNGKPAELGTKVEVGDEVSVKDVVLKNDIKPVYIAFNKPVGVTCTTDLKDKHNIIDYIGYPERIFHIGRLDKDSEGLIFLTNDGDIVNKILRAGNNHEKEYQVEVHKPVTPEFIQSMANGVRILNTVTQKCYVKHTNKYTFTIILKQGLNRQIRRMCEALGYNVIKLKRVRIMNVHLKGIRYGEWRYLTSEEMSEINEAIAHSSKTEEASDLSKMSE
jgi:23S rRNA pseudouridine2604 synthase